MLSLVASQVELKTVKKKDNIFLKSNNISASAVKPYRVNQITGQLFKLSVIFCITE